ncbi:MAG: peptide chain release factor N(5)-glutamine methyltransferase [Clostridiales bacterium]|nr:peptide chain release factor N(5)-glutamine methyltransferase [Clostridiales bacterium]
MSKKENCKTKNGACKTSIGGQAVLEGVMMRGKSGIATAVRDSDGIIRLEADRLKPQSEVKKIAKWPVIRGMVNFFSSMVTGVKILMRSAEVYGEDETATEPSKFEKWLAKTFKVDIMSVVITLGVVLGLAFSIGLFFVIPHFLGRLFSTYVTDKLIWVNLFEGLVRILIFVGYVLLTSLMKDIKRTYMYHGAEHKTITAYEKGLELTVENVRTCRRVHDRCGTTFMFFVMFVSILVFSVFGAIFPMLTNGFLKLLSKLALLPLVAGLSYELLKLLAKTDSPLVYPLKVPGLLIQRITTSEPDDQMIEVAITAFNKVLKMDADENEPCCKFVVPEKVNEYTEKLKNTFKEGGIDDGADAEWLICEVTGLKRSDLSGEKFVTAKQIDKIEELAKQRLKGRPLWYVLGSANFYGYDLKVDERALIPRPETEELVEIALKTVNENSTVLDLCTGSGAIALVIKAKTGATVTASDISSEALSLASENFKKYDLDVNIVESDMFENIEGKFNLIISNPPYIKIEDIPTLQTEVKDYEPALALLGGEDGLDFYRIIASRAKDFLEVGGTLLLEVGIDQAESVKTLLGVDYRTEIIKDLSGIERIVKAELI